MSTTTIKVIKKVDYPRPVKSTTAAPSLRHVNFSADSAQITGDELIIIAEGVAAALAAGSNDSYLQNHMSWLCKHLKVHGPRIEIIYKDTLDRLFVAFRNASQDEDTHLIIRVHLLELIELRAKNWISSDGANMYYKHKSNSSHSLEPEQISVDTQLSSSPPLGAVTTAAQILGPGEVIKTSGKYLRPTKIPGKNYSKDEVVIRNADSGKVMGIKGRRVHMIEELSETIISFQRVTPGAKERLVQITGPTEEKINHAKQLIEDTIRRNASPVRLDSAGSLDGSIDSLNSLEETPRHTLHHSFSTNDATVGEYNYTVNVGNEIIKITGKNLDFVFAAKQELDKFFASKCFGSPKETYFPVSQARPLRKESVDKSDDSEDTYKNPVANGPGVEPSTPVTPHESPEVFMFNQDLASDVNAKSNFNINLLRNNSSSSLNTRANDTQNNEGALNANPNGLVRSRRNHFARKSISDIKDLEEGPTTSHTSYTYEALLHFSSSPFCTALPKDWAVMNKEFGPILRKVLDENVDVNKNHSKAFPTNSYNKLAINNSQFSTHNQNGHNDKQMSQTFFDSDKPYDGSGKPYDGSGKSFDGSVKSLDGSWKSYDESSKSYDGSDKPNYNSTNDSIGNNNSNYYERRLPRDFNETRRPPSNTNNYFAPPCVKNWVRPPSSKNHNNSERVPFGNFNGNTDRNGSNRRYRDSNNHMYSNYLD